MLRTSFSSCSAVGKISQGRKPLNWIQMRSWYVTEIFGALYMNTHHEWISSGIRQRRYTKKICHEFPLIFLTFRGRSVQQLFLHLLQKGEREEDFVKSSKLSRGKERLSFLPESQHSCCDETITH